MVRGSPRQVFSATRTHFPLNTTELPEVVVNNLKKYAVATQALGVGGGIAVNCLQDQVKAVVAEAAPGADIEVLHVPVWGAFVPALNTLLGEAQRRRSKYILYQSLEVICDPVVLRRLLDFHTSDTLVVGPILTGHTFTEGLQVLNGRTTPWNTLALWSTRKLGLTGFLSIAEGLPDAGAVARQISGDSMDNGTPLAPAMGSEGWWEGRLPGQGPQTLRQVSLQNEVPAGVEEVTAIALLQHLLGEPQARALLIELPKWMESKVSWKTNWGGDEKRRQWHEHKMKTKITRPAAQMKKLFGLGQDRRLSAPLLPRLGDCRQPMPCEPQDQLEFGSVHHFGEYISPPSQVELICMFCSALFMANFSSAFSAAFAAINTSETVSAPTLTFVGLLLAGVYLPMPLSLVFLRWLSSVGGQRAGILFFAGTMVCTHVTVAIIQSVAEEQDVIRLLMICVRLLEGLGAAVLFQTRFILSQLSTQDKHVELQAKTFLAADLGLGFGALLPYVCAALGGQHDLTTRRPEIAASLIFAMVAAFLLAWTWLAFPASLYRLSHRVRFPEVPHALENVKSATAAGDGSLTATDPENMGEVMDWTKSESDFSSRAMLLISGTLRVFVQSAALMAVAINMRDHGDIGLFRQSRAVAMLCLIPVPFEGFASGVWFKTSFPGVKEYGRKLSFLFMVLLLVVCISTASGLFYTDTNKERATAIFLTELILLQISLAFVAPLNVSKLYQHKHVERSLVTLEWIKAYAGRLLGPMVALLVHNLFGFGPLIAVLFTGTFVVALTA